MRERDVPLRLRLFGAVDHSSNPKTNCNTGCQAKGISRGLQMLCLGKIAYKVYHSAANGIPLRAEVNDRKYKVLFLDIGLMCRVCGLSLIDLQNVDDVMFINSGARFNSALPSYLNKPVILSTEKNRI